MKRENWKRKDLLNIIKEQPDKYFGYFEDIAEVNPSDLVLELGPGARSHKITRTLASKVKRLVSLESDPDTVKALSEELSTENIVMITAKPEDFQPATSENFDIISCWGSLYHYDDPKKVLENAHYLLKSTGRLILACSFLSPGVVPFWTAVYGLRDLCYQPPHKTKRYYTLHEIFQLFRDSRFEPMKVKVDRHYEDLDTWLDDLDINKKAGQVAEKLRLLFENLDPDWREQMQIFNYKDEMQKYYFYRDFVIIGCKKEQ